MMRRYLPQLAGVCINIDRFMVKQQAMLAALDKTLYSYTCDSREQLARARDLGVSHVITNYPERTRSWLQ